MYQRPLSTLQRYLKGTFLKIFETRLSLAH
jgi:hypothetical protein